VRLITALLTKYFNLEVLKEGYEFAPGGVYVSPTDLTLPSIKEFVNQFPNEDDPQVFGLHSNANITYEKKVVGEFMNTLIEG
jgi:dynein heavy chain